jgi:hypothetical protein
MTDLHENVPTDVSASSEPFEVSSDATATPVPETAEADTLPVRDSAVRAPRTPRILLAGLILAAAGFIWFNYFASPDSEQVQVSPVPLPNGRIAAPAPATVTPGGAPAVAETAAEAGETVAGPAALPLIAPSLASDAAVTADDAVAEAAPGVARQLVISELPFLVPSPPAAAQPEAVGTAEVQRPTLQRVTVNPFTPVVLNEVVVAAELPDFPQATSDLQAEALQEDVLDVPIPAAPPQATVPRTVMVDGALQAPATAPAALATIPAPTRATAPPALPAAPPVAATVVQPPPVVESPAAASPSLTAVRNLPRALPGGSLSPAPRLLMERRVIEDIPVPNLAQLATVQEPEPVKPDPVAAPVPRSDDSLAHLPEPGPLPATPTALAGYSDPLAAGITPLSRYLRDNNVVFTGSVLGPVSVGVFHTSLTSAAIVISLGQSLPDTSIVLTDLRGQQAELTLGEASQILTMELRR